MAQAFIGLGSNLGDRQAALHTAVAALSGTPGIRVFSVSTFLETRPVGGPDQSDFLNAAAELSTELAPRTLLERLLEIEDKMGRMRTVKCGPRIIDLDLLLYQQQIIDEPGLQVPHPLMHTRAFVLKPLAEIAPQARHPRRRKSIAALLAELEADDP